MTRIASFSRPGSEFDDFLFAPVGEDRNGMLLSVLSALARQDLDPWQEAARLAHLPAESATERLASLIALQDVTMPHREPEVIAGRLISLLPRQSKGPIPARVTLPRVGTVPNSSPAILMISFMICIAIILGAQFIATSRRVPAPSADAPPTASATLMSKAPLGTSADDGQAEASNARKP